MLVALYYVINAQIFYDAYFPFHIQGYLKWFPEEKYHSNCLKEKLRIAYKTNYSENTGSDYVNTVVDRFS